MKQKIIIDTDPGIDDAMAILFAALSPQLELLGLTTTFGNVKVAQATRNALILCDLASKNIPVAEGVETPLKIPPRPHPDFVHGKDGFGNIGWPNSGRLPMRRSAARFLVDSVREHPGEITLIALGPLGNLAKALELDPDIASLVKEVVLMGGAHRVYGNVSPVAEANMICDPHAADIVFSAGWPVTMVGLDVTTRVLLQKQTISRIRKKKPKLGEFLALSSSFYFNFYQARTGLDGCYFHDGSAVAFVLQPELFTTISGRIRVSCEGISMGQTIVAPDGMHFDSGEWDNIPSSRVCVGVDETKLLRLFEQTLAGP